ncbi:MAG TPA: exonuclease domain-containing protein [Casimicrobiaceae bacterium]|nr:exonuclease domain-containing protein [Casimicrobiaceae bacterium]
MLPLPAFAFVDLETTGTSARDDRITEIGIVRVDDDGGPPRVTEWSTLVDPEVPIPAAIQALTGITDAMVASAPSFSRVANDVRALLDGCIFVAHNARFDYGFLKQAFARLERAFSARVLCTVRLSRRLFPDADGGHGLDALIARHGIPVTERHRALGDARAIWSFVERLYRDETSERIDSAIRRILRVPSLPPQLPPDAIDALPEAPGVYLFYGDNPLPLYVGKSVNLRERVGAHFSQDWRSETDLRLSREIRRIEHERTAGELGALLREAVLVKSLMPAHNRALRRKEEAGIAHWRDALPRFMPAVGIDRDGLTNAYGPFASRASFRAALRALCAGHRLCARRLGLERGGTGPCFARQLKRCNGVCVGEESPQHHDARVAAAMAPLAIPAWPVDGPACVREASADGERVDVHVFRDWCWLGTAGNDGELAELVACPPPPSFDLDVTRLLLRRYGAGALKLTPLRGNQEPACAAITSATQAVNRFA